MKKWAIYFLFLVIVFLIKNLVYQYKNFSKAEMLYERKDYIGALNYYERVILAYSPFSNYVNKSIHRIYYICSVLDSNEEKIYCLETIKSDLNQIASFYSPYNNFYKTIQSDLLTLKTSNNPKNLEFYKNLLNYNPRPNVYWSLLTGISFILWISSVIFLIWKGLGENINVFNVFWGLLAFVSFFSLWILGLYMA